MHYVHADVMFRLVFSGHTYGTLLSGMILWYMFCGKSFSILTMHLYMLYTSIHIKMFTALGRKSRTVHTICTCIYLQSCLIQLYCIMIIMYSHGNHYTICPRGVTQYDTLVRIHVQKNDGKG